MWGCVFVHMCVWYVFKYSCGLATLTINPSAAPHSHLHSVRLIPICLHCGVPTGASLQHSGPPPPLGIAGQPRPRPQRCCLSPRPGDLCGGQHRAGVEGRGHSAWVATFVGACGPHRIPSRVRLVTALCARACTSVRMEWDVRGTLQKACWPQPLDLAQLGAGQAALDCRTCHSAAVATAVPTDASPTPASEGCRRWGWHCTLFFCIRCGLLIKFQIGKMLRSQGGGGGLGFAQSTKEPPAKKRTPR